MRLQNKEDNSLLSKTLKESIYLNNSGLHIYLTCSFCNAAFMSVLQISHPYKTYGQINVIRY
jgi:hypothetical protein